MVRTAILAKSEAELACKILRENLDKSGLIQHCGNCEHYSEKETLGDGDVVMIPVCDKAPDAYIPPDRDWETAFV